MSPFGRPFAWLTPQRLRCWDVVQSRIATTTDCGCGRSL